jgi:hypothetical protein
MWTFVPQGQAKIARRFNDKLLWSAAFMRFIGRRRVMESFAAPLLTESEGDAFLFKLPNACFVSV